ncbi:MAG: hypothetical protein GXP56_01765 [Deltaproteobacteria bacterium]|nr:hypothetical protein [Deltaproteobacteria bacterium]
MMTGIKKYILISGLLSLFLCMALPPAFGNNINESQGVDSADNEKTESAGPYKTLLQELDQGFELDFKATALYEINGIATSSQNPGNRFAQLSDKGMVFTLRPDMSLVYNDLLLTAKPRLELEQKDYKIDGETKDASCKKAEIIEFLVRKQLSENLFASYGWQNLQWGPSFVYSPSNPFFNDNGKKDLVKDLKGKGFLKLIFVHDFSWSASLIYNTDKGAFNESDFEKTLALKIDYSGDESYASVILSHTDNRETRLGAFGGTTLSDAVIIYGEASIQQGSLALFPVAVEAPFAWEMNATKKNDHTIYTTLLAGIGYTFESGDTMTFEYLYYGQGYDSTEASNFYQLKNDAAVLYASQTALSGYGTMLLGKAATNQLDFLRRNYLLIQYLNDDIIDDVDLVSRVTYCLDDSSSRLYSSLSHDLNDNTELKISAMLNTGGSDASFGTFLSYQIQLAVEYSF